MSTEIRMTATEVQRAFGTVLRTLAMGSTIIITHHGVDTARISPLFDGSQFNYESSGGYFHPIVDTGSAERAQVQDGTAEPSGTERTG